MQLFIDNINLLGKVFWFLAEAKRIITVAAYIYVYFNKRIYQLD